MTCFNALQRLKKAKESAAECVKYKICPDCAGDLLVTAIRRDSFGLVCMHCKGKFESSMSPFHYTEPADRGPNFSFKKGTGG